MKQMVVRWRNQIASTGEFSQANATSYDGMIVIVSVCLFATLGGPFLFESDYEKSLQFLNDDSYANQGTARALGAINIFATMLAVGLELLRIYRVRNASSVGRSGIIESLQATLILLAVVPTSFFVAMRSPGGSYSWTAILVSTFALFACTIAREYARRHSKWTEYTEFQLRSFLLLSSVVFMNLFLGIGAACGFDAIRVYQAAVWAGWLIPLAMLELHFRRAGGGLSRASWLAIGKWSIALLSLKIWWTIIDNYSDYVPPNFLAPFLVGRQRYFYGLYGVAFYAHIIASPIAMLLSLFLLNNALRKRYLPVHRLVGRFHLVLVATMVAPSSAIMGLHAQGGPIAGIGFVFAGISTFVFALIAWRQAMKREIASHRVWAVRTTIILFSAVTQRVMGWGTQWSGMDPILGYQIAAWLSWLLPLACYEVLRTRTFWPKTKAIVHR